MHMGDVCIESSPVLMYVLMRRLMFQLNVSAAEDVASPSWRFDIDMRTPAHRDMVKPLFRLSTFKHVIEADSGRIFARRGGSHQLNPYLVRVRVP